MEGLTSRLGTRFLVVTVVPNILLIGYVSFLVASGAPGRAPSPARALKVLDGLTGHQIIAMIVAVFVISIATHPLQIPLVQLLEGYWWGLPFGKIFAGHAIRRFQNDLQQALRDFTDAQAQPELDWRARNLADDAQFRLDWLPEDEADLRPTALGNTLWRGETRAGQAYGLQLGIALPRLNPLMSPSVLAELSDRRNQLDAAARLCVMSGIATAVSLVLLILHGPWLFLAVAMYLLCWASYRAAIAAARGFSDSLAAAVDLYHLQLFDALSLQRPADIDEEYSRNGTLMDHFRGLDTGNMLRYVAPKEQKAVDGGSAKEPPE